MVTSSLSSMTTYNDSLVHDNCTKSHHEEQHCDFCLWSDVLVVPILVSCGVTGNIICILVINKVRFGFPSTKILIKFLATFDMLYLIGSIFYQTMSSMQHYSDWLGHCHVYTYMKPYLWPYMSFLQTTESWLIVAIAADRFIAVRYPLNSSTLCSRTKGYKAVTVIIMASLLYNVPHAFEFALVTNNECQQQDIKAVATSLWSNQMYILVYKSILTTLVKLVLPLGLLLFFSVAVVHSIHTAARRRRTFLQQQCTLNRNHCDKKKQVHNNVTPVLLVIILVFVVCQLVGFLLYIYDLAGLSFLSQSDFRLVHTLSNLMLVINAAVNFIIYISCSKAFLAGFIQVCFCSTFVKTNSQYFVTQQAKNGTQSVNGDSHCKTNTRITVL